MDELFCEDCGAQFVNQCNCAKPDELEYIAEINSKNETWVGIDGHKYIGDPKRASLAYHADDCRCITDPEGWY